MKYFLPLIIALSILINPVNTLAEELILAGGCFWCLEHDLESLKGINFVQSGYSGGDLQNPTYENHEGHQEVVLVDYDSQLVTLPEILRLYFRNIDPLDGKGQFCDRGDSYRPVIFFKSCRIIEAKSEKVKMKKGYAFLKKELGEEGVVQRAAKEIINSII